MLQRLASLAAISRHDRLHDDSAAPLRRSGPRSLAGALSLGRCRRRPLAQAINQQLRILLTGHALGPTFDTLDDIQQLSLVLGQPLLQDLDFLDLVLEPDEQFVMLLTPGTSGH